MEQYSTFCPPNCFDSSILHAFLQIYLICLNFSEFSFIYRPKWFSQGFFLFHLLSFSSRWIFEFKLFFSFDCRAFGFIIILWELTRWQLHLAFFIVYLIFDDLIPLLLHLLIVLSHQQRSLAFPFKPYLLWLMELF
jgi:hypothetical protein